MYLSSYSTKANDVCQWPSFRRDALVMGIEIEVEPRQHSSQQKVLNALGDDESTFFCKSDGSLQNGVEIVTVPMTLADYRGPGINYRDMMRPLLPVAMSGSRTSRCGMHVHVNRGALSPLTLAKMLLLLNEPCMQPLIATVAQRAASHWAQPHKKTWGQGRNWRQHNDVRYQPLNVTGPTAEFRIFRGSLRYDRIIKNLEFCHAVVMYCRETSAAKFLDPVLMLTWIRARERDYPALVAFLDEVGA